MERGLICYIINNLERKSKTYILMSLKNLQNENICLWFKVQREWMR